MKDALDIRETA